MIDRPRLAIPEYRDGGAAGKLRTSCGIHLVHVEDAVDRSEVVEPAGIGPALALGQIRLQDRNRILETFQLAHQDRTVRPRARGSGNEVISAGFRLETRRTIPRDPFAEPRLWSHKVAIAARHRRVVLLPNAIHEHTRLRSRMPSAPPVSAGNLQTGGADCPLVAIRRNQARCQHPNRPESG